VETIYQIQDLTKQYPLDAKGVFRRKRHYINAVDHVNLTIHQGETFGVVGESGSGKTTLARLLLRLIEPTEGSLWFKQCDLASLNRHAMKNMRRQMQMIFQDPYSSLDPRKTIFQIVAEPLRVHKLGNDREIQTQVRHAVELVDLPISDDFLRKLPEELSGGQRQRIGIARALVINPEFVIADEPVSMLDASVKAGIIALMLDLKAKIGLTYLFITHELALAYHICDRLAVMYLGEVVEQGDVHSVIRTPVHPYTKLLIAAVPPLVPDANWSNQTFGVSSFARKSCGCKFYERCPETRDICITERPTLSEIHAGHFVACHRKLT
jgi:oligopeptide transport system ATP-binding protein